MDELLKKCRSLDTDYKSAIAKLDIEKLQNELVTLDKKISDTHFWDDNKSAQEIMKQQAKLTARTEPWIKLGKQIQDVIEMLELGDISLKGDLQSQYEGLASQFEILKSELRFNGKYDDHDAVVTLSAGVGTDARTGRRCYYVYTVGQNSKSWRLTLLRVCR